MSITLTTNYKEVLQESTVHQIEELIHENYDLECMLEFIDEYNEQDFINHYETYVSLGEEYSYEAVDAFLQYHEDASLLIDFKDAYVGCYSDVEEFTQEYYDDRYDIPFGLYIDWTETWNRNLKYDYQMIDNFIFRRNF